jgi:hypothetical protein
LARDGKLGASTLDQIETPKSALAVRFASGRDHRTAVRLAASDCDAIAIASGYLSVYGRCIDRGRRS